METCRMGPSDDTPRPFPAPSIAPSTILGLGLVVVALLLALPGVRAVRADADPERSNLSSEAELQRFAEHVRVTPALSEVPPGPTCAAGDPRKGDVAMINQLEAQVEQLRATGAVIEATPNQVVLNGRGFNYGPPLSPEQIDRIRATLGRPSPRR
jgi:hypothetical protein